MEETITVDDRPFERLRVEPDGDCFFTSVLAGAARQHTDSDLRHLDVRRLRDRVADWLGGPDARAQEIRDQLDSELTPIQILVNDLRLDQLEQITGFSAPKLSEQETEKIELGLMAGQYTGELRGRITNSGDRAIVGDFGASVAKHLLDDFTPDRSKIDQTRLGKQIESAKRSHLREHVIQVLEGDTPTAIKYYRRLLDYHQALQTEFSDLRNLRSLSTSDIVKAAVRRTELWTTPFYDRVPEITAVALDLNILVQDVVPTPLNPRGSRPLYVHYDGDSHYSALNPVGGHDPLVRPLSGASLPDLSSLPDGEQAPMTQWRAPVKPVLQQLAHILRENDVSEAAIARLNDLSPQGVAQLNAMLTPARPRGAGSGSGVPQRTTAVPAARPHPDGPPPARTEVHLPTGDSRADADERPAELPQAHRHTSREHVVGPVPLTFDSRSVRLTASHEQQLDTAAATIAEAAILSHTLGLEMPTVSIARGGLESELSRWRSAEIKRYLRIRLTTTLNDLQSDSLSYRLSDDDIAFEEVIDAGESSNKLDVTAYFHPERSQQRQDDIRSGPGQEAPSRSRRARRQALPPGHGLAAAVRAMTDPGAGAGPVAGDTRTLRETLAATWPTAAPSAESLTTALNIVRTHQTVEGFRPQERPDFASMETSHVAVYAVARELMTSGGHRAAAEALSRQLAQGQPKPRRAYLPGGARDSVQAPRDANTTGGSSSGSQSVRPLPPPPPASQPPRPTPTAQSSQPAPVAPQSHTKTIRPWPEPSSSRDTAQPATPHRQQPSALRRLPQPPVVTTHERDVLDTRSVNGVPFERLRVNADGDCFFTSVLVSAGLQHMDSETRRLDVRGLRALVADWFMGSDPAASAVREHIASGPSPVRTLTNDIRSLRRLEDIMGQLAQPLSGVELDAIDEGLKSPMYSRELARRFTESNDRDIVGDFGPNVARRLLPDFVPTPSQVDRERLIERAQAAHLRERLAQALEEGGPLGERYYDRLLKHSDRMREIFPTLRSLLDLTNVEATAAAARQVELWTTPFYDRIPEITALALGMNIAAAQEGHTHHLNPGASRSLYVFYDGRTHYTALNPVGDPASVVHKAPDAGSAHEGSDATPDDHPVSAARPQIRPELRILAGMLRQNEASESLIARLDTLSPAATAQLNTMLSLGRLHGEDVGSALNGRDRRAKWNRSEEDEQARQIDALDPRVTGSMFRASESARERRGQGRRQTEATSSAGDEATTRTGLPTGASRRTGVGRADRVASPLSVPDPVTLMFGVSSTGLSSEHETLLAALAVHIARAALVNHRAGMEMPTVEIARGRLDSEQARWRLSEARHYLKIKVHHELNDQQADSPPSQPSIAGITFTETVGTWQPGERLDVTVRINPRSDHNRPTQPQPGPDPQRSAQNLATEAYETLMGNSGTKTQQRSPMTTPPPRPAARRNEMPTVRSVDGTTFEQVLVPQNNNDFFVSVLESGARQHANSGMHRLGPRELRRDAALWFSGNSAAAVKMRKTIDAGPSAITTLVDDITSLAELEQITGRTAPQLSELEQIEIETDLLSRQYTSELVERISHPNDQEIVRKFGAHAASRILHDFTADRSRIDQAVRQRHIQQVQAAHLREHIVKEMKRNSKAGKSYYNKLLDLKPELKEIFPTLAGLRSLATSKVVELALLRRGLRHTLFFDRVPEITAAAMGMNIVSVTGDRPLELGPGSPQRLYVYRDGTSYSALNPVNGRTAPTDANQGASAPPRPTRHDKPIASDLRLLKNVLRAHGASDQLITSVNDLSLLGAKRLAMMIRTPRRDPSTMRRPLAANVQHLMADAAREDDRSPERPTTVESTTDSEQAPPGIPLPAGDDWDTVRSRAVVIPHTHSFAYPMSNIVVRSAFDVRHFVFRGRPVADLTIRIGFITEGAVMPDHISAVEERARQAVEELYNLPQYQLPSGEILHVTLEFTISDDAHTIVTLTRDWSPPNQRRWPVQAKGIVYAHELGHQLGLRDEYASPEYPHFSGVRGSLMGATHAKEEHGLPQSGMRGRYLQLLGTLVSEDGYRREYQRAADAQRGREAVPAGPEFSQAALDDTAIVDWWLKDGARTDTIRSTALRAVTTTLGSWAAGARRTPSDSDANRRALTAVQQAIRHWQKSDEARGPQATAVNRLDAHVTAHLLRIALDRSRVAERAAREHRRAQERVAVAAAPHWLSPDLAPYVRRPLADEVAPGVNAPLHHSLLAQRNAQHGLTDEAVRAFDDVDADRLRARLAAANEGPGPAGSAVPTVLPGTEMSVHHRKNDPWAPSQIHALKNASDRIKAAGFMIPHLDVHLLPSRPGPPAENTASGADTSGLLGGAVEYFAPGALVIDPQFPGGPPHQADLVRELGRALHHQWAGPNYHELGFAQFNGSSFQGGALIHNRRLAATVSRRAAAGPRDFVAEVFTGLVYGRRFSDAVLDLYTALGGAFPAAGRPQPLPSRDEPRPPR
ncbi:hypothetical protein [Actinacidiphila alni]|uniref:hypothetical protein n=1 Tax=Actinacidiphila alni TaxID=380248 RepID=UPI000B876E83|nr:hypothetical protein [Actinacidiphila alni]